MGRRDFISMVDEQERAELRQFSVVLLLVAFGLICLYAGLKIGLSEGRMEKQRELRETVQYDLPEKNRREVVSRWYQ